MTLQKAIGASAHMLRSWSSFVEGSNSELVTLGIHQLLMKYRLFVNIVVSSIRNQQIASEYTEVA